MGILRWRNRDINRKELQDEINRLKLELAEAHDKITQLERLIPDDDGFCHTDECQFCQHYRQGDIIRIQGVLTKHSVCELSPHFCEHFK